MCLPPGKYPGFCSSLETCGTVEWPRQGRAMSIPPAVGGERWKVFISPVDIVSLVDEKCEMLASGVSTAFLNFLFLFQGLYVKRLSPECS